MSPPDDAPVALRRSEASRRETADSRSDPLWYKDAIIYQLHMKAFFDANNDGVGDFEGLTRKLDYLQDLGVTALWLLPFYPSPLRDDGYDIADYKNVHPAYGRMGDFRAFVREAHRRGLRVITELVINHTSDQHPWFQRARHASPGSAWRDFYVWSDTDQKFLDTRIIFIDTEKSNWTWDPVAQAYYWHRFYAHQPDLNFDNPRVFRAIVHIMQFWLDLGVDGLRLDAVPYLIEREGTINENLPETHDVLKRLRGELDCRYGDRMLLAEANQWPEDVLDYFGDGDECHMAFHFPLMPRIYMALATEDRHPITDIMRQTPAIPESCQWAVFLRNHDELTLEMVTDRERDYLWDYYAADRRARINLGIRRRLAPLMENDRRKIELLKGLLLSMPGTPVLYYGDELGMGDNVYLGDRDGVRTPMQWSPDRNGGFSRADPAMLYLPPIMDPVYGFEAVNVEAQSRSPSSLLNWTKRLIAARRSRRALGRGTLRFLYPANRKVIAYLREWQDETILCIANLSRSAQAVALDLAEFRGRNVVEVLGRSAFPPIGEQPYLLTLQPHSFFWFELPPSEAEIGDPAQSSRPEFITLVMPQGWRDLFDRHNLPQLERDVIPGFLPRQRWFAAKDRRLEAAWVLAHGELAAPQAAGDGSEAKTFLVAVVQAQLTNDEPQLYLLPLAAVWGAAESEVRQQLLPATLAELRQSRREGALVEAVARDRFGLALFAAIEQEASLPLHNGGAVGELRFRATPLFAETPKPERLVARRLEAEQSNSSVLYEDYALLKLYRRLQPGLHPEVEMSRFLVERAGFANTPPPLATVELTLPGDADNLTCAAGVLFGFVRNQGDGWTLAQDYLTRYLDDALNEAAPGANPPESAAEMPDPDNFFLALARQLGLRTAQMHRALAERAGDDPAFRPERIRREDLAEWRHAVEENAEAMLARLERGQGGLHEGARSLADTLIAAGPQLFRAIRSLMPEEIVAVKTRYHGDLHLAQVIAVQNDFYFIDFEGEPARPLAMRRRKSSPLRDVAGMIRSFDYAATAAVRQLGETRPAAVPRMTMLAEAWRQRAIDGFRAAYRREMRGCPSYPASKLHAKALVDFFTLEKAIYEVSYELANRPAWVAIPINGILRVVEKATGTKTTRDEHAAPP
ncbi:MAG: maltose alpha-D-glucosyltransferase [Alphaproteobacteria bacterium]|nr:maltose alpha-D-glucosyltransferase [Alphaproteobacteria bacterium]